MADSQQRSRIQFFTATWCAPCQRLKKQLQELLGAEMYSRCVVFIDVDDAAHATLMTKYGVQSIPTLVFHHGGAEEVLTGAGAPRLEAAVTTWLAKQAASELPMSQEADVAVK